MVSRTSLMVEIRDERPELLKIELALLGLLTVLALFFSHALIHNYVKATKPVTLVLIPYLIPAVNFASGPVSSSKTVLGKQATRMFGGDQWVSDEQIFVQNSDASGWAEWQVTGLVPGKKSVSIYLTNAADYGMVQVSINDQAVGLPIDLYGGGVVPHAPVDLGTVEIKDTTAKLRLTVVGKNPLATAPFYQFGIQGIAFAPASTF